MDKQHKEIINENKTIHNTINKITFDIFKSETEIKEINFNINLIKNEYKKVFEELINKVKKLKK